MVKARHATLRTRRSGGAAWEVAAGGWRGGRGSVAVSCNAAKAIELVRWFQVHFVRALPSLDALVACGLPWAAHRRASPPLVASWALSGASTGTQDPRSAACRLTKVFQCPRWRTSLASRRSGGQRWSHK